MSTDFYQVLGVSRDADGREIKAAYRKLALQYHPDRNPGDSTAEERFKEINEAYAVLSDPEKRSRYDRYGDADAGAQYTGDIFDIFASVFGGSFGAGFGGTRGAAVQHGIVGEDLEVQVAITLEQAREGATIDVEVDRLVACDHCRGERAEPGSNGRQRCDTCHGIGQVRTQTQSFFGTVVSTHPCPTCRGLGEVIVTPCTKCRGAGRVEATEAVQVNLPRGIDGGYRLRVPRQGNAGLEGGHAGDLYVYIEMEPHEHFRREEDDLIYDLRVGVAQAALGCSFEVPTMDGPELIDLKPGTQPGTVIRLAGKGMPRLRRVGMGDQLVNVMVEVPTKLSPRARDLLEQYAEEVGEELTERESLGERIKGLFGKRRKKDAQGKERSEAEPEAKEPQATEA